MYMTNLGRNEFGQAVTCAISSPTVWILSPIIFGIVDRPHRTVMPNVKFDIFDRSKCFDYGTDIRTAQQRKRN